VHGQTILFKSNGCLFSKDNDSTNHGKKGEQQENELMKVHAFVFILNGVSHRNYLDTLNRMSN
jgi:hypothetical protein